MEILFSHRNAIYYLEHCRIVVKDNMPCFIKKDKGVSKFWTIPYANIAVLLLGSGTSLTQQAARLLAEQGVFVAFSAGGGTPLYMASQSEYREPEYLQKWYALWQDEATRLAIAKDFQYKRIENVAASWQKLVKEHKLPLEQMQIINQHYSLQVEKSRSGQELMGYEGNYTKRLYSALANLYNISFIREQQGDDVINKNLDRCNYLAYGLGGCALWVLGIPHCFPVSHGLTRKGALVFDIADMIKDACILPLAFSLGMANKLGTEVRQECITWMDEFGALTKLFGAIKEVIEKYYDSSFS